VWEKCTMEYIKALQFFYTNKRTSIAEVQGIEFRPRLTAA
jgi:hypothetical protein